jgi:hypothetical protein
MLSIIFQSERKFDKLSKVLEAHKQLVAMLMDAEKSPDRLVPKYFRIGFYGQKWDEDLRNKQYIYKKPTNFSLPLMIRQLEEVYAPKYGAENVVVLSGNKKPEVCWLLLFVLPSSFSSFMLIYLYVLTFTGVDIGSLKSVHTNCWCSSLLSAGGNKNSIYRI